MKILIYALFFLGLSVISFNAVLAQQDTAFFWAGGYFLNENDWHDTIYAKPGDWIDIPIYFKGTSNVWSGSLTYPLGAKYSLADSFDINGCSGDFWPFNTGWQVQEFFNYK